MIKNFKMYVRRSIINLRYAVNLRKHILILRLIITFLGIMLLKRRPLRYVDFAIDYHCNLKCDHCFKTSLEKDEARRGTKRLAIEDYKRIANDCMALGVVNFSFQGGELFLCKDWEKIIEACKPWKNIISVTTNGTMLTEENLDRLKKVGVDILTVSLDSGIPEEHDRFRGVKGTYEKVMQGIESALKRGFNITIGTTVYHENLKTEGIQKIIEMAVEKKFILNLILAAPAGKWQENYDVLITDEDVNYIRELTARTPYIRTDFEANFVHWGCGAMKEIIYLTPYGDVLPCPFMHISFGNALDESIAVIRSRALKNRYLKDYHSKCLVAEDREFIDRYLSKTFTYGDLPMDSELVFNKVASQSDVVIGQS